MKDYKGVGIAAATGALSLLIQSIAPATVSYAQTGIQPMKPASEATQHSTGTLEETVRRNYASGWGAPYTIPSVSDGVNLIRYSIDLATTENGNKKPEVFEKIFNSLGVTYIKRVGSREERHKDYKEQFERYVVSLSNVMERWDVEGVFKVIAANFSPETKKEFKKKFGFHPDDGVWVLY